MANELTEDCFPDCGAFWLISVAGVAVGVAFNQVLRWLDSR